MILGTLLSSSIYDAEDSLAIAVEKQSAIIAGDIGSCKIVTGIFVGNYGLVHIFYRVQGNLIRLAKD